MQKVLLSWSSGKDSAWTLHALRHAGEYEVAGLLTTYNEAYDRVAMHAVRRELVEAQAKTAGVPLWWVPLPWPCSNEEYQRRMREVCRRAESQGIAGIAFGDLFLRDIRRYREYQLRQTSLFPLFPLWGRPTRELAAEMVMSGLRARLTCIDPAKLDRRFAGREFSEALAELPAGVDPCGENGEFHTFAYDGPMFRTAIEFSPGEVVERDGFVFADLMPAQERASAED